MLELPEERHDLPLSSQNSLLSLTFERLVFEKVDLECQIEFSP